MSRDDVVQSLLDTLETGSCSEKSRAISELLVHVTLPQDATLLGKAMSQALKDSEPLIRAEAAEALGEPELIAWEGDLIRVLEHDEDPTVRASAAESLGDANSLAAVPALEAALDDSDAAVRGYAAGSLGLIGAQSSLAAIALRIGDEESSCRFDMMAAVVRIADSPEAATQFLDALAQVSDLDASRALNVLEDLQTRATPSALVRKSSRLRTVLLGLRDRLDQVHRLHIERMLIDASEDTSP